MSAERWITWSSAAEVLTFAAAALEGGGSLRRQDLDIAEAIASALRKGTRVRAGSNPSTLRSSSYLLQYFTGVNRTFDGQPESVKLVMFATYAAVFDDEASDELQARLLNSGTAGALAETLRLRSENVSERQALTFSERVFGARNSNVVARWICGSSIFGNETEEP
jgi:hypothetical protein